MQKSLERAEASKGFNGGGGDSVWSFKKCPRCRGDVFIDEENNQRYEKCLQCGYEHEVSLPVVRGRNIKPEKEKTGVT
jgi:hypothetical protein